MNKQDKGDANDQSLIEDLTISEIQAATVKGGPIFMNYQGIDGYVTVSSHDKSIQS